MEEKIAEHLVILMKRKGISKSDLVERGINPVVYQNILQEGRGKGKSYSVKSLGRFLKAIDERQIQIFNLTIKIK